MKAREYAERNGGGVGSDGVSLGSGAGLNDRISVRARRAQPGFFSRIFGISTVEVRAGATARSARAGAVRGAAPIAVDERHPLLQCTPLPCFGQPTDVPLANLHDAGAGDAAGAFGLVDLAPGGTGSPGAATLADWIREGFDGLLSPASYASAPGAQFNSAEVRDALSARLGEELLLPVFRRIDDSGANARFEVIGFVGFRLTGFEDSGSSGRISGEFTRVTWDAEAGEDPAQPDFGVRSVGLVE